MAPVLLELGASDRIDIKICATAQHREMLDLLLSTRSASSGWALLAFPPPAHSARSAGRQNGGRYARCLVSPPERRSSKFPEQKCNADAGRKPPISEDVLPFEPYA
jgi:hypothetical protein